MATWPSTIPAWLMGVSLEVDDGALESTLGGYNYQRRGFDRRIDIMAASLSLTNTEFNTFETFVQTTLNQGADQFTGPYLDGAGYNATGTLQMVDGAYTPTWDGERWTVAAQVRIINRRDPETAVPEFLYTIDFEINKWPTLLGALENTVNNNEL